MKSWVEEVKTNGPTDAVYAVVGNKTDLIDQETVNYKVVEKYAGSIGAIYRLVSAKEGKNIEVLPILFRTCSTP
jgi:GTPase SAR1 family protein